MNNDELKTIRGDAVYLLGIIRHKDHCLIYWFNF